MIVLVVMDRKIKMEMGSICFKTMFLDLVIMTLNVHLFLVIIVDLGDKKGNEEFD